MIKNLMTQGLLISALVLLNLYIYFLLLVHIEVLFREYALMAVNRLRNVFKNSLILAVYVLNKAHVARSGSPMHPIILGFGNHVWICLECWGDYLLLFGNFLGVLQTLPELFGGNNPGFLIIVNFRKTLCLLPHSFDSFLIWFNQISLVTGSL